MENKEVKESKNEKSGLFKLFPMKFGKDTFIVLILIGILLAVIVWPTKDKKEDTSEDENKKNYSGEQLMNQAEAENSVAYLSASSYYQRGLEKQLETILSEIEGVGEVKVMITLSSNEKSVIEKDRKSESNRLTEEDSEGGMRNNTVIGNDEETVYITDESGKKYPYIVQTQNPQIEGVLVVAQGGDNLSVNMNITQAIQALFPVEVHKIRVVKMKS